PERKPRLDEGLLAVRHAMAERLRDPALRELIEPFDIDRFHHNISLAANLSFGPSGAPAFSPQALAADPDLRRALDDTGLTKDLMQLARQALEVVIEILGQVKPGNELLEQIDLVSPSEAPGWRALLSRVDAAG